MKYDLVKANCEDVNYIKEAKLYNVFKYAHNLTEDDILKINRYVDKHILVEIKDYKLIICNGKRVGCLLVAQKDDGVLIDEIYLGKNFRNKGIGTCIINKILEDNSIVYLWVYKENVRAISLYKKLKFNIIEETETRYHMKYIK
jgi:ribosomal protein S18 acetylase RimI-like enzyme